MRIIDSHFHWRPRSVLGYLCQRKDYPRAAVNDKGGYTYWRHAGKRISNVGGEWFDLDAELAHLDSLSPGMGAVCSVGPFSVAFADFPGEEGRDVAQMWNEEMAGAQRKYAGRFWGTGVVPLNDTRMAIEVMNHAILDLGLVGINLPGSIGPDPHIDAERLEPFYDRVEELGVPLFLHPTDGIYEDILDGYNGALYLSLGRVVDLSVSAYRLVLSGMMERHPKLKLFISHTGGALPYQAGRMDKNSKAAKLPQLPSVYLKRMYTDTVSPHAAGIKFAIDFYGVGHIMYGSDYPCWSPAAALKYFGETGMSQADQEKIFCGNARRILNLRDPGGADVRQPAREAVPAK
ncbi:MAG TPA: amidohydrolase family protein [Stellaceae bacterium]|nr:amidohydrolase family protein [Stellaceae bacterium]